MKTPIYIKQPFDKEDSSTWPESGWYMIFLTNGVEQFKRFSNRWHGVMDIEVKYWLKKTDLNELKKLIG